MGLVSYQIFYSYKQRSGLQQLTMLHNGYSITMKILRLQYQVLLKQFWIYKKIRIVQSSHTVHTQFPLLLTWYIAMLHLSPLKNQY